MFRLLDIRTHATQNKAVMVGAKDGEALPVCTVAVQRYTGWSAVMLRGELDRRSAAEVRSAVAEELTEDRPVIVELVGLDFSDVEGLRSLAELVRIGERCRGHAGVEVHGARGQVARLIELMGLEDLLMAASRP
jgi:anti-anti-sigma factor